MSMFDLTELNSDDLRAALFDALVERLDAKAHEDPSISVVNRMPTAFAVSRRGNLLTLSQGLGVWLLRGDLKWKDRCEKPRTFNVGRATNQSRLVITPDRMEGTPDEILDRIVAMFLEWTATGEKSLPAVAEPTQESRPAARVPQVPPTVRKATQERRAPPAGSTQERRPGGSRNHTRKPASTSRNHAAVTCRSHRGKPAGASNGGQAERGRSCTSASGADSGNDDANFTNVPAAARDSAAGARAGERAAGPQRVLLNQRGGVRRLYR
jgi:hypothetical protein